MKPDNSVLTTARAVGGEVSSRNGKPSNKVLMVSLESAPLRGAVVLRCRSRAIFRAEALGLSSLIYEVLPQARRMVVDLRAVQSLDTAALGELVLAHLWAEAAGYELRFASLTEPVEDLLDSTNLISLLNVDPTVDAALGEMQQRQPLLS